jgi:hypothetical protein
MEIERTVSASGRVEMWAYEWDMSHAPGPKQTVSPLLIPR